MAITLQPLSLSYERRAFTWLLLVYCLLIVYGSFIPFRFNLDPNFIRWRWEIFLSQSLRLGIRQFSTPDVVSNILLFCPFGFLLIGTLRNRPSLKSSSAACLTAGAFGLLFGFMIEAGQTLSPFRSPSMLDALCNGSGALIGAMLGYVVIRPGRGGPRALVLQLIRERPSLMVLGFLVVATVVDAFYPFDITLDVSTVWANLKQSQLIPFRHGLQSRWIDLFIEKALVFAAIGYLLRRNIEQTDFAPASGLAWAVASAGAMVMEVGKLFFVGPVTNVENILVRSAGALLGILIVPKLASVSIVQRKPARALFLLLVCLFAYAELRPFDWIYSIELNSKIARIEWLPFAAYYSAAPEAAFFDLAKKLYLSIPLGYLIAAQLISPEIKSRRRTATLIGIFIATVLEAAQILVRSRTPSITDVSIFSLGAWIGIKAFEQYRRIISSKGHSISVCDEEP